MPDWINTRRVKPVFQIVGSFQTCFLDCVARRVLMLCRIVVSQSGFDNHEQHCVPVGVSPSSAELVDIGCVCPSSRAELHLEMYPKTGISSVSISGRRKRKNLL
jgi:hypothetical protein